MALTLYAKSANDAFIQLLSSLKQQGTDVNITSNPANVSWTKELLDVQIEIDNPKDRHIYVKGRKWSMRAACAEFAWYRTHCNNVDIVSKYLPNWTRFTDDYPYKRLVNSNYGYIWQEQLPAVIEHLRQDHNTRRAAIAIYSNTQENMFESSDMPCTLSIVFMIRDNKLNMSVSMRSNDVVYGFCIDCFVFTLLQELVANELGIEVGKYVHSAVSMHIYERFYHLLDIDMQTDYATKQSALQQTTTYSNFWQAKDQYIFDNINYDDFAKWSINHHYRPDYKDASGRFTKYFVPELNKWCHYRTMNKQLAKVQMTPQQYFDKYLLKNEQQKRCKWCGNELPFIKLNFGYHNFCNCHCSSKYKMLIAGGAKRHHRFMQLTDCKNRISKANVLAYLNKTRKQSKSNFTHLDNLQYCSNAKHICCKSSIELQTITQFELLGISYSYECLSIKYQYGGTKRYVPDFVVTIDNKKYIVECKHTRNINDNVVQSKVMAAKQYCIDNNYAGYMFITEKEAWSVNKIKKLFNI